jgi:hypothetical protein
MIPISVNELAAVLRSCTPAAGRVPPAQLKELMADHPLVVKVLALDGPQLAASKVKVRGPSSVQRPELVIPYSGLTERQDGVITERDPRM